MLRTYDLRARQIVRRTLSPLSEYAAKSEELQALSGLNLRDCESCVLTVVRDCV